jgi:ribonuclease HI
VGAWAFVLVDPATRQAFECADATQETTNNRMELMAVIEALCALRQARSSVLVLSDSSYVIKCGSLWLKGWKLRGWKRKEGPLKNVDLLQRLDEVAVQHDVEWRWVRGHAGDAGNERADLLANEAMDRLTAGATARWEKRAAWNGRLP